MDLRHLQRSRNINLNEFPMATNIADLTSPEVIASLIYLIRGQRVMLDSDLAVFFGVDLRSLNQQVSRNKERFPTDFAFQLTGKELAALRSQIVISKKEGRGGR